MECTLCLKPERQYDPHYRYKMPPLEVVMDARSKQRKTHLPNAALVAKSIFRPEAWLVKYLALRNSTDSSTSGSSSGAAYISGHHSAEDLQQQTFSFIREYVLCKCGSPETLLYVEGKKKHKVSRLRCHSCGRGGKSNGQDEKMLSLFAAQPMPPELCPMGGLDRDACSGLEGAVLLAATVDGPLDVSDWDSTAPSGGGGAAQGDGGDGAAQVVGGGGASQVVGGGAAQGGGKHVTWDEAAIAEHRACAGVLYGTQRIEESTTPFLYYSESVSRSEGLMMEMVPGHGIATVSIEALQERLGVLAFAQSKGGDLRRSGAADDRPVPPPPWLLLQSRSDCNEYFYFNPSTREATWTWPGAAEREAQTTEQAGAEVEVEGGQGGASSHEAVEDDEDDEEVPLPTSKLAAAADCAADFANRRRVVSGAPSRASETRE